MRKRTQHEKFHSLAKEVMQQLEVSYEDVVMLNEQKKGSPQKRGLLFLTLRSLSPVLFCEAEQARHFGITERLVRNSIANYQLRYGNIKGMGLRKKKLP